MVADDEESPGLTARAMTAHRDMRRWMKKALASRSEKRERNCGCDSIRALALACPHAVYRRRTVGDRQQRRRTGTASCGSGTQKLLVRRFRLRRRTCSRHVQSDWIGQAQRSRSGVLPSHRPGPDRQPSHQPNRRTPAMEPRPDFTDSILPSRLDTLIRCPPKR